MLFCNVKLKFKLNLKLEHIVFKFLLKLVLRRRKRSDCGVISKTLGIYCLSAYNAQKKKTCSYNYTTKKSKRTTSGKAFLSSFEQF